MAAANGVISHRDAQVLFRQRRGREHLCVRERDGLRWLHFDQRDVQTIIDLTNPARLVPPYTIAMLTSLLFRPPPTTLLNLGIGGGSFERFFHHHMPKLKITSVETDHQVISLARQFFQFPSDQPVFVECAERFLKRNRQVYDLIFCDIHEGDRHPNFMFSAPFLADIQRGLSPMGVAVVNLLPGNYDELLKAVISLRESFRGVWLADVPERRNLVLLCFNHLPPSDADRTAQAEQLSTRFNMELTALLPSLSEIGRPGNNLAIQTIPEPRLP